MAIERPAQRPCIDVKFTFGRLSKRMIQLAPPEHTTHTPSNTNSARLSSNGGTAGSPR